MSKNYFKFLISYRNNVISESIFDADCYNPIVRQMVNIKELVPEIRKQLQKVLSTPTQKLSSSMYVGKNIDGKEISIKLNPLRDLEKRYNYLAEKHTPNTSLIKDRNLNKETIQNNLNKITDKYMIVVSLKDGSTELFYKKNISLNENSIVDVQAKSTVPFANIRQIEFVEELQFDFSLFLNDNYIIQRKFTVFNFNPETFFSEELVNTVSDICRHIKNYIKKADIDAQYLDFEIMSKHEMPYNDLKVLSQEEKKKLLKMEYSYN
jgi:hypothetical protein